MAATGIGRCQMLVSGADVYVSRRAFIGELSFRPLLIHRSIEKVGKFFDGAAALPGSKGATTFRLFRI